jgi:sigma-B regulation protein RsbU (phosphoserine phosphatase)
MIRGEALLHEDVDKLLEAINEGMHDLMAEEGFFATIVLGRYWPASGKLQLVRGGHLHPLWIFNNDLRSLPDLKGLSLGITPEVSYEKKELILSPGESILFLTDGVTEAENGRAEMFGNQRLIDHIRKTNGPPWGKGLLDAVNAWRGDALANDDITLLEIWRDPE